MGPRFLIQAPAPAPPPWPNRVGEWVALAADLSAPIVALVVLGLWLTGRNPVVTMALRRERLRTVGSLLTSRGHSRRAVRRAVRGIVGQAAGAEISVQSELHWLDDVAGAAGRPVPVALHGVGGHPSQDALELARRYLEMAQRLKARGLFGGGTAPVIAEQADVAKRVSSLFEAHAMFAMDRTGTVAPHRLALVGHLGECEMAFDFLRAGTGPGGGVDGIAVSHLRERMVVTGTLSEALADADRVRPVPITLSPHELDVLRAELDRGKVFDGVLPALRDARLQRDPASGWNRLHLALAETTFGAVLATHNVGERGVGRERASLRGEARLLTLACVPVTRDGQLCAVRRSRHVATGQGWLGPAVSGNLEMRPRFGIRIDQDAHGAPDPLLALEREAREEIGTSLPADRFTILGTVEFSSAQEVGVTILLTSCAVELSASELAGRMRLAHQVEGAWENEGFLVGIPLPSDPEHCDALLHWTLTATDHQPHLTASIVAHCHPLLVDRFDGDTDEVARHLRDLATRPGSYAEVATTTYLPDGRTAR